MGEGEVTTLVRAPGTFDARVVGVDLPDVDLAAEWRKRGLTGVFADISRLPFPSRQFDLVLGIEVLEHVPDPAAALAELDRLCRGELVVSVPREPVWRVANLRAYLRRSGTRRGTSSTGRPGASPA